MYALTKTEKNNQESGTNEKQEIVELTQEPSAKKSLKDICAEIPVQIKTRVHFQEAPKTSLLKECHGF